MSGVVFALAAASALCALLLVWEKSVSGSAVIYAAQAACVSGIAIAHSRDAGLVVLAIAVIALIAKAIVLPTALRRAVARAGSSIVVDASVHTPAALLVAFALIAVGFLALGPVSAPAGLALGETLVGLWLVASRRALLSQVVGLMAAENGAALLMTVLVGEQGALIEGLLLLEALAVPFALLVLAGLVRRAHGSADTSLLRSLSGNREELG
jgi:hydrogenase-4 component E